MKAIEAISSEIMYYQELRQTPEVSEYLNTLNLCYDLIANTSLMINNYENWTTLGDTADEILGEKPEDSVYRYGTTLNPITDYLGLVHKNKPIKDFIKETRESLKMTKYAFSKLTGYSESQLRQWENGQNTPGIDKVLDIIEKVQTHKLS